VEKHGWKIVLAAIAALMVLFVLYQNGQLNLKNPFISSANQPGASSAQGEPAPGGSSAEPAAPPAGQNPAPSPVAAEKELRIELVASGDCWTEVTADGQDVYKGMLHKGDKKTITAKQKMALKLGSAGDVEVFRGGKSLGHLGAAGEVSKKEFTLGSE
jgi:hypothetical protein